MRVVRSAVTIGVVALMCLASAALVLGKSMRDSDKGPRIRVLAVAHDSVSLSWEPRPGAEHYLVYRNGTLLGRAARTEFRASLLWPRTRYKFKVVAAMRGGETRKVGLRSARTSALPDGGYPSPFGARSIWRRKLPESPAVDADSTQLVQHWLGAYVRSPNMTLREWGVAVAEAHPSDPRYVVPCREYKCSLNRFGPFRVPITASPDPEGDGHLAVYDPKSGREWGMWQARYDRLIGQWEASAGAAVSLKGNGTPRRGRASANAANFPLLAGLIRPEEILARRIEHPLVFGQPGIGPGRPACPATANISTTGDPLALQLGTQMQLDPAVDVPALDLPGWEKTIATALQEYGMYLRDNAGTLTVYAENPVSRHYDAWKKLGLVGDFAQFSPSFPWDRMRVIASPRC